jgi:hypothetical protein
LSAEETEANDQAGAKIGYKRSFRLAKLTKLANLSQGIGRTYLTECWCKTLARRINWFLVSLIRSLCLRKVRTIIRKTYSSCGTRKGNSKTHNDIFQPRETACKALQIYPPCFLYLNDVEEGGGRNELSRFRPDGRVKRAHPRLAQRFG